MLPASTGQRTPREASQGKQKGRTVEIQRLIGRAMRAVADMDALGERTLWLDCDVLQADGGTRCAGISASTSRRSGRSTGWGSAARSSTPSPRSPSASSTVRLLDLDYVEDSSAEVDLNVVMTAMGGWSRRARGRRSRARSWTRCSPSARRASMRSRRRSGRLPRPFMPELCSPSSRFASALRPASAPPSGSSGSCASGKRACARTCWSRSGRALRSSRRLDGLALLERRRDRLRPDANRRADRHRRRLPRRGRDHPPGPDGPRSDDCGDALGRRRDRDGGRRRLLLRGRPHDRGGADQPVAAADPRVPALRPRPA